MKEGVKFTIEMVYRCVTKTFTSPYKNICVTHLNNISRPNNNYHYHNFQFEGKKGRPREKKQSCELSVTDFRYCGRCGCIMENLLFGSLFLGVGIVAGLATVSWRVNLQGQITINK